MTGTKTSITSDQASGPTLARWAMAALWLWVRVWLLPPMLVQTVLAQTELPPVASETANSAQARGRALYRLGVYSNGRPVQAVNGETGGETGVPLPAAFVACANCHGYQARGKSEGGSKVSDIRPDTLFSPYQRVQANQRRRPPYDAASFFTAITTGKDPGGQMLDATMPRFKLSAGDAADLLAYLQKLQASDGQGVSNDRIDIGVLLPNDVALAAQANTDWALLTAWRDEINQKGGFFRRRINLLRLNERDMSGAAPLLALLDSRDRADSPTWPQQEVPVLSMTADVLQRERFALYPGIVQRTRLLARYALAQSTSSRLALAHHALPAAQLQATLSAVQPLLAVKPVALTAESAEPAIKVAKALRAAGIDQVLLLGSEDKLKQLVASASTIGWQPLFLWESTPRGSAKGMRAVTAQATLPGDITPEAKISYTRYSGSSEFTGRDPSRQFALLGLTRLLSAALENTGRDLNRESLLQALAGLQEFRSGVARPGSFSARRHTGTVGVYVIALPESALAGEPVWLE